MAVIFLCLYFQLNTRKNKSVISGVLFTGFSFFFDIFSTEFVLAGMIVSKSKEVLPEVCVATQKASFSSKPNLMPLRSLLILDNSQTLKLRDYYFTFINSQLKFLNSNCTFKDFDDAAVENWQKSKAYLEKQGFFKKASLDINDKGASILHNHILSTLRYPNDLNFMVNDILPSERLPIYGPWTRAFNENLLFEKMATHKDDPCFIALLSPQSKPSFFATCTRSNIVLPEEYAAYFNKASSSGNWNDIKLFSGINRSVLNLDAHDNAIVNPKTLEIIGLYQDKTTLSKPLSFQVNPKQYLDNDKAYLQVILQHKVPNEFILKGFSDLKATNEVFSIVLTEKDFDKNSINESFEKRLQSVELLKNPEKKMQLQFSAAKKILENFKD